MIDLKKGLASGIFDERKKEFKKPNPIFVQPIIVNNTIFGGSNGSIDLITSNEYFYDWGNGITSKNRSGLIAGNYTVIIKDRFKQSLSLNFTITQPNELVATLSKNDNIVNGGNAGTINLSVSGGIGPYTYNWGNGQPTTQNRTGLSQGNYTVLITDSVGTQISRSINILQPNSSSPQIWGIPNLINGNSNNGVNYMTSPNLGIPTISGIPNGVITYNISGATIGSGSINVGQYLLNTFNEGLSVVTYTITNFLGTYQMVQTVEIESAWNPSRTYYNRVTRHLYLGGDAIPLPFYQLTSDLDGSIWWSILIGINGKKLRTNSDNKIYTFTGVIENKIYPIANLLSNNVTLL